MPIILGRELPSIFHWFAIFGAFDELNLALQTGVVNDKNGKST